ncbi:MAG TPA: ribosome biogenesis factor YjgA [Caldimonas sp.]|jgi:ribosome-associated protein|nr:ribosome biogenesis factor YjgA [Caldimonas sp.]HEX2540490.1 ribosome biogenesis factor YjgA [Caldimonas sp.]
MTGRPADTGTSSALPELAADTEATTWIERPSKTRLKQQSHELQALGEALVALSDARLEPLGLGEPLLDAIRACRGMRSHEARRRQMQLIGKLMRSVDVEPVRAAVAESQLGPARDSLALHRAERWRAELIADDAATTRFASAHPEADLQQLRTLVRNARKDASGVPEQRNGRAYRELFRFIRRHAADD